MFIPKNPPLSQDSDLYEYLTDLEARIEEALLRPEVETINFKEHNVALDKLRNGDVYIADGTNYDPGAGKGLYRNDGTTDTKVG